MNPLWKQNNPHDQLTVILMAVEGHFQNLTNDVIDVQKYVARTTPLLEQLNELKPYLKGERTWYADTPALDATTEALNQLAAENPIPEAVQRQMTHDREKAEASPTGTYNANAPVTTPEQFEDLIAKAKRQTPTFP
jgi:hypothetical protein